MRDAAPQGTYKVQALDRAFAVLDLLSESDMPLGLAQVAASPATAQEHRAPLPDGFGTPPHGGAHRERQISAWASGFFDFGNRAIEQYDLRERAQPHLRHLVAETEENRAPSAFLEAARVILHRSRLSRPAQCA